MKVLKVGVAGGSGYTGQELLGLLKGHKYLKLEAKLGREDRADDFKDRLDLVFLCTPNETSQEWAPQWLSAGVSVIDLSGAFRLKKFSYPDWYEIPQTDSQYLSRAEFGLQPWQKIPSLAERPGPRLIANPGCFSTAAMMALIPLLKEGVISEKGLVIDAKSGTSGAGKKLSADLMFTEMMGEFRPYRIGKHQHWPEIVEYVQAYSGAAISPAFVTELLPVERGISLTLFADSAHAQQSTDQLIAAAEAAYHKHYSAYPDISYGQDEALLSLKKVQRTPEIRFCVKECFGKLLVVAVIDNLMRGAASQALMNANCLVGAEPLENLL